MRFVIMALLLAACAAPAARDNEAPQAATPEPEPTIGKYEQTWTKAYADTTCGDWQGEMDEHQRFVMAGDMLIGLWRDEGSDAFPGDDVLNRYANGIGNACEGAGVDLDLKVPEVAVPQYSMASDVKPPTE